MREGLRELVTDSFSAAGCNKDWRLVCAFVFAGKVISLIVASGGPVSSHKLTIGTRVSGSVAVAKHLR